MINFKYIRHFSEYSDEIKKYASEVALKQSHYGDGKYIIIPPLGVNGFIREGELLNHCLGTVTYADRHVSGSSFILFIRKIEEPEIPYLTVEISAKWGILQVRGFKNTDPPQKILEFVNEAFPHLMLVLDVR